MERRLKALFDYQRFEKEPGLSSVIDGVHKKFGHGLLRSVNLEDDDLELVSAAGDLKSGIQKAETGLKDVPGINNGVNGTK